MRRVLALVALLFAALSSLHAQEYRYEFGPSLGVSGYLGDLNKSNMYKHPGLVAGGIFRYIANSRWAIKGDLLYTGLKGNSDDVQSKFPHDQHYSFSSSVIDLGGQVEFNFLHFGSGPRYKNYKRISPYLTLGLGMSLAFTDGKTGVAMNLPMGVGLKYKLKERLNLGFEFTMRKCFGDNLDGMSDLYGVKHSFAKNTDWYSVAMFTVTYEFSKRCVKCHYVE